MATMMWKMESNVGMKGRNDTQWQDGLTHGLFGHRLD